MKIAVKEAGKELQILETKEKYIRDCVSRFIGEDAYVELIRMNQDNTLRLGIDEDGVFKKLPLNFRMEMTSPVCSISKILGTAVFVRIKEKSRDHYDYEVADLTDQDMELIRLVLDRNYQKLLAAKQGETEI